MPTVPSIKNPKALLDVESKKCIPPPPPKKKEKKEINKKKEKRTHTHKILMEHKMESLNSFPIHFNRNSCLLNSMSLLLCLSPLYVKTTLEGGNWDPPPPPTKEIAHYVTIVLIILP